MGKSHVQILTTPTADTPGTTLLLHFDNKRYLIGSLAEGTQRACVQMGARLIKVSECFLTGRTEWMNTGGMIGMILTLADSLSSSAQYTLEESLRKLRSRAEQIKATEGEDKLAELEAEAQAKKDLGGSLTIFGPPNLNHTLATARRFVFRKGMPINIHEIRDNGLAQQDGKEAEWQPFWADDNVKVWAMSISPSSDANKSRSSSISPLKRSFDEMRAGEDGNMVQITGDLTQEDRDYLTVKAVVGDMFNSSWRLDTLYETPLAQVKLPATIFVRDPETNKIKKYTGPLPGDKENPLPNPELKVLVRKPWPGALINNLPDVKPAKQAVSYIFRNHMQRGKFHPERAIARGVKPGHNFSKLAQGEEVQNDKGEWVKPEEVMDPPRVGGGVAVIDLPGPEYIDNLIARPEWREQKVMEGVGAVMWMCGKDVASDERLHAFMNEFSHLEHIVSSADYCPNHIAMEGVAGTTARLKRVDPDRYRVPVHDVEGDAPQQYGGNADFAETRKIRPLPEKAHIAVRGQRLQLIPSVEFKPEEALTPLNVEEAAAEVPEEVMQEARKAQEAAKNPGADALEWMKTLPSGADKAEVITLGTGSALPSKYRNVSSTLVLVPGWGNIMFDAGENTLGQLKRVFDAAELKQVLRDLRLLVISHMHADHQLGTTSVIKAWYQEMHNSKPGERVSQTDSWEDILAPRDRLAVISEAAMQQWLYEYSQLEDYGYSRIAPLSLKTGDPQKRWPSRLSWFLPPVQLSNLSTADYQDKLEAHTVPAEALQLSELEAVAVKHCHGARAVSVTLPSGFKVSYSGDCRPSEGFARIGKGSTVCIHEATFDDELQGDAEAKNHSTTSEALDIAQKMNARACILTHFSQRYQKFPILERVEASTADGDVMDTNTAADALADEVVNDPEDEMASGPLEDAAATFPDQTTAEGDTGKQYDLPRVRKVHGDDGSLVDEKPKAVKFKLQSDMKVAVAFDYMRIKVGDVWQMENFTPAFLKLLEVEENKKEEGGDGGGANGGADGGGKAGKKKAKGNGQQGNKGKGKGEKTRRN
ncbi:unnamed protein product [Cercospora beticola]|nr:unnamed protein product [Cercospora beticola]